LKWVVERQPNLDAKQAMIDDLVVEGDRVCGVVTKMGVRYDAGAVIVTTGTFLRGLIPSAESKMEAGRAGEQPRNSLSPSSQLRRPHRSELPSWSPPRRLDPPSTTKIINHRLLRIEIRLPLNDPFQPELVCLLVALGARCPYGRALLGV